MLQSLAGQTNYYKAILKVVLVLLFIFVVVEMVEVELLLFVFVVAIFAKGDNAQGFLQVIYSSKLNHAIVLWF